MTSFLLGVAGMILFHLLFVRGPVSVSRNRNNNE
jgi:hypothetical protein